jgi:hypothetical protein
MFKNLFKILALVPFLLAFQCADDSESTFVFNDFNVNITPQSTFSINDTIWIDGIISSKVFDLSINDSVFYDYQKLRDDFIVMKFVEPTQSYNCIDAIDKFELITEFGEISFLPICENSQIIVDSEITIDNLSSKYRIGLKPLIAGDYVISWITNTIIKNTERNEYIVANYPLEYHPNQIGYSECGNVSWRDFTKSKSDYYFTVE